MMLTVVAPLGTVLGVGVGMLGPLGPGPPLPLQPHAARTRIAPESRRNRMTAADYASRMPAFCGDFRREARAFGRSIYRSRIDLHFFDGVSCRSGTWRGSRTARAG